MGINLLWVAYMTYVPTWAGFLYLGVVVDVYSRKVLGWAFRERMTSDLMIAVLNIALHTRRPKLVIHHIDQGSQYTSVGFGKRCEAMGVKHSKGTVGDAYENAMAASFFATLKFELIDMRSWKTNTETRLAIFTWIESWCNLLRRHSGIGRCSPNAFERSLNTQKSDRYH